MRRLRRLALWLQPVVALLGSTRGESKAGAAVGIGAIGVVGVGRLMAGAEHAASGVSHVASGLEHTAVIARGASHLGPAASLERATVVGAGELGAVDALDHARVPSVGNGSPEVAATVLGASHPSSVTRAVEKTPVTLLDEVGGASAGSTARLVYQQRSAQLVDSAIASARQGNTISRRGFVRSLNEAIGASSDPALLASASRVDPATGKWALHFRVAGHEVEAETDAFEILQNALDVGQNALSLVPDSDDDQHP